MLQIQNINSPGLRESFPSWFDSKPRMNGLYFGTMETKKCSKCKKVKLTTKFYNCKSNPDNLQLQCIVCVKEFLDTYYKTKKGMLNRLYGNQVSHSKKRGHESPTYTSQELVDFAFTSLEFHQLYDDWVNSGYDKWNAPSFDRIDDYEGYSFKNFNKWMTWQDNANKYHSDHKNGINNKDSRSVIGTHKETGEVIEFHSINEARRQTGGDVSRISNCCSGKIMTGSDGHKYRVLSVKGWMWRYKTSKKKKSYE